MTKPVGKPDAGNRHVRFDERGGETERNIKRRRALPRLYRPGCTLRALVRDQDVIEAFERDGDFAGCKFYIDLLGVKPFSRQFEGKPATELFERLGQPNSEETVKGWKSYVYSRQGCTLRVFVGDKDVVKSFERDGDPESCQFFMDVIGVQPFFKF